MGGEKKRKKTDTIIQYSRIYYGSKGNMNKAQQLMSALHRCYLCESNLFRFLSRFQLNSSEPSRMADNQRWATTFGRQWNIEQLKGLTFH